MKIPPLSMNDPMREEFVAKMLKHDINIDEYCAIYEKCSIPLNNNLSKLALRIFGSSSSLVNQYGKYRGVLNNIIQEHVANSIIGETDTGCFIIQNQDAFTVQFHDIENWVVGTSIERTNNSNQPTTAIYHAPPPKIPSQTVTPPKIPSQTAPPAEVNTFQDFVEESSAIEHHDCVEVLSDQQNTNITQISPLEHNNSLESIHNLSAMLCEQIDDVEHNSSNILVQTTVKETTNTFDSRHELAVKKAMKHIMTWKSVIFTKTDFTQICNKSSIRQDAIKRLINLKLLTYEDNYWIEPTRSIKVPKKNAKRILREGWIKGVPLLNTDVAKLEFIQLLQKEVNVTYEDYLKCFYPQQQDNVFTNNNWILSDEFIVKMESNFFYKEHVRWNEKQFRPFDMAIHEINVQNEASTSILQSPHLEKYEKKTTNNNTQNIEKQMPRDGEEVVVNTQSQPVDRKRKAETDENNGEHRQTRTQTRKLRRN